MSKYVQTKNPRTNNWALIDREQGKIVRVSKEKFEGIKVIVKG